MDEQVKKNNLGRKIWYGTAITLSVLVLVISAVSVVGAWVVEQSLSKITVNLLGVTYDLAGGLRQVTQRINNGAGEIKQITTGVSDVSAQISQNVEDQGLVKLLLPEEQEQKLVELVDTIQQTVDSIRDVLQAGFDLYSSINQIPFVDLPQPKQETIDKLQQASANGKAAVEELTQGVSDFRSGAAEKVDKITQAADKITQGMDELSSLMVETDADLAALQDSVTRLQQIVPVVLALVTVLLTLFLVYVIYTQVEVIRLFVQRWKQLSPASAPLTEETSG